MGFFDRILKREPGAPARAAPEPPLPFPTIEPEAARGALARGALRALDVRFDGEVERRPLPGALHVPLPEIEARLEEIEPGAEWLVVCGGGARSLDACRLLHDRGRRVRWLRGGLDADPGPSGGS